MITHATRGMSTTEILNKNMNWDGVYVEGDDNVMITDYDMEEELYLAADVFGL